MGTLFSHLEKFSTKNKESCTLHPTSVSSTAKHTFQSPGDISYTKKASCTFHPTSVSPRYPSQSPGDNFLQRKQGGISGYTCVHLASDGTSALPNWRKLSQTSGSLTEQKPFLFWPDWHRMKLWVTCIMRKFVLFLFNGMENIYRRCLFPKLTKI